MRALPLFFVLALIPSCRLLSGEVACHLHRDCPRDVGMDFCEAPLDGGVGRCVADDPRPTDDDDDDDDDADGGADAGDGDDAGPLGF